MQIEIKKDLIISVHIILKRNKTIGYENRVEFFSFSRLYIV